MYVPIKYTKNIQRPHCNQIKLNQLAIKYEKTTCDKKRRNR